MTATDELGRLGPPILAVIVIAVLIIEQPISADLGGISMNWIGALIVALGGIIGFFNEL